MSAKKDVAKTQDNFPTERPAWMGSGTIRGNEGVKAEDMQIPRLSIIQDLSPQWKKGRDEYIDGAEVKMIFNTATQRLYGTELYVVPVLFRKEWVVWKDLDSGGGFRGAFNTQEEAVKAMAAFEDAKECEIVDTHQHFVLVVDPDSKSIEHAVISMSKSQCKPSRQWNTMIQTSGGDRFERMYRLSVVDAQNAAGKEYYNWKVSQMGYVDEPTFKEAEKLYEAIRSGKLDVKRDQDVADTHAQGEVDDKDEF